jgi:hypothetical protein
VLVILGVAFGITRLLQLLADHTGVRIGINLGEPGIDSFSTFVIFAPAYPLALLLVGAPIVAVLRRIDAGEPTGPVAVFRELVPLLPRLLWVEVLSTAAVGVLAATVVGIPFAVKKGVDWTFAGQAIFFERLNAREALRASTQSVRGRWWRVAGVDLALFVVGAVVGPLVGALLIIFTDAPLWTVNLSGLLLFGLALPYMIITLTLMYLDPRTSEERAPRALRRRLFLRRERPVPAEARS